MTRRRYRWRPARTDFATWAVSSLWEAMGGLMVGLMSLRARLRTRRGAVTWLWLGGRRAA